ncbi:cathepsin L isoform X2 [Anabrus simplex]
MKLFTAVTSLLMASDKLIPDALKNDWDSFKNVAGKTYSAVEEQIRLNIFKTNKLFVDEYDKLYESGAIPFKLKLNPFADLSHEEFLNTILLHNISEPQPQQSVREANYVSPENVKVPDEIDWRKKGVVTPVKNQGNCASCWTFSSAGAIESHHAIKNGNLIPLSEQSLIDCSKTYGTLGCEGGWMYQAYNYVKDNGIDKEESYPYKGMVDTCQHDDGKQGASVNGYINMPSGNEELLKEAVGTIGPVSVTLDASVPSFQFYSEGIYEEPKCKNNYPTHAVLVVGYGTENGRDYWLIKNSWGTKWGENGYMKLARNKNNHCGIAYWPCFPSM